MSRMLGLATASVALVAACKEDPRYVQAPMGIEYGTADSLPDGEAPPPELSITLPYAIETMKDATERAQMAADLGVEVPYVKLDDVDVSLEWTVKNLSADPTEIRIFVNGANPYFAYIPLAFVIDPEEDPTPPPLMGDIPIELAGNETRSGVFREDTVREAGLDLELITRGNMNPFAALLQSQEDLTEYQPLGPIDPLNPDVPPAPVGNPIPVAAFASIIRFDVSFTSNTHAVLEFAVRVRDHRGILHDELLDAPAGELTQYAPADFAPPGAAP